MVHPEADGLESAGRWLEAAELWRGRYADAHDPEAAIRLAFVCWYVLVEHGCIPDADGLRDVDFARLESVLQKVTTEALAIHADDPDVLFHFGYMASLFPWCFDPNDVSGWERRASEMLRRAWDIRPDDPVFEMVYLGDLPLPERPEEPYRAACRRARPVVPARYVGDGEFDGYFRQVLTRAA